MPVIAKPQRTMSGGIDREDMHTLIAFAQNQRQEVRELNVAGSQSSIRRGDAKNETLIAHTLRAEGYDASEDGTGRSVPLVSCAVKARDGKGPSSDGDGDGLPLVPVAFRAAGQMGFTPAQVTPPINATDGGGAGVPTMNCGMAVRRLTPREVERLQGFPDDYTLVHYRGKPACDGPRYRALGNSMAVPVMAWLGRRIALIASL